MLFVQYVVRSEPVVHTTTGDYYSQFYVTMAGSTVRTTVGYSSLKP